MIDLERNPGFAFSSLQERSREPGLSVLMFIEGMLIFVIIPLASVRHDAGIRFWRPMFNFARARHAGWVTSAQSLGRRRRA